MKEKKKLIFLISILITLIILIVLLSISIKQKGTFVKPEFDSNVLNEIPENIEYKNSTLNITENYAVYINGLPTIENKELIVDFISMKENNIWIKLRILDTKGKIIAESGLVKPGEYLKSVKLNKKISNEEQITYMIIGYEMDTYLSAGTVKLNTKVGA